ncbi:MAG: hypothetical protein M3319_09025 [Actinomycetota bacterium]|nr:hypothetical protein [Actinomycetota bacterium]
MTSPSRDQFLARPALRKPAEPTVRPVDRSRRSILVAVTAPGSTRHW